MNFGLRGPPDRRLKNIIVNQFNSTFYPYDVLVASWIKNAKSAEIITNWAVFLMFVEFYSNWINLENYLNLIFNNKPFAS